MRKIFNSRDERYRRESVQSFKSCIYKQKTASFESDASRSSPTNQTSQPSPSPPCTLSSPSKSQPGCRRVDPRPRRSWREVHRLRAEVKQKIQRESAKRTTRQDSRRTSRRSRRKSSPPTARLSPTASFAILESMSERSGRPSSKGASADPELVAWGFSCSGSETLS